MCHTVVAGTVSSAISYFYEEVHAFRLFDEANEVHIV